MKKIFASRNCMDIIENDGTWILYRPGNQFNAKTEIGLFDIYAQIVRFFVISIFVLILTIAYDVDLTEREVISVP